MEIKIVLHVLKVGNKNSNVSFMVNYWPSQPQKGRNVFEEDINFYFYMSISILWRHLASLL